MLCLSGHGVGFHLPVTVDDPLLGAGGHLDREPALGAQAVRLLLLQLKRIREMLLTDIYWRMAASALSLKYIIPAAFVVPPSSSSSL